MDPDSGGDFYRPGFSSELSLEREREREGQRAFLYIIPRESQQRYDKVLYLCTCIRGLCAHVFYRCSRKLFREREREREVEGVGDRLNLPKCACTYTRDEMGVFSLGFTSACVPCSEMHVYGYSEGNVEIIRREAYAIIRVRRM